VVSHGRHPSQRMQALRLQESEEQFLQAVRGMAHALRWFTYHTRNSRRSDGGFPDLVMVRPPRLVIAELKVGKRRPTDAQQAWLEVMAECPGVEAYCWWPTDWPEIEACLGGG
jgi:hypothetical protein